MKSFIEILREFGFQKKKNVNRSISGPGYQKIDNTHQAVHPGPTHLANMNKKGIDPKTGQRNIPEETEESDEFNLIDFFKNFEKDME